MSHRRLIRLLSVMTLAALALGAAPDAATDAPKPQTGPFPLHITERSKVSAIATIVQGRRIAARANVRSGITSW